MLYDEFEVILITFSFGVAANVASIVKAVLLCLVGPSMLRWSKIFLWHDGKKKNLGARSLKNILGARWSETFFGGKMVKPKNCLKVLSIILILLVKKVHMIKTPLLFVHCDIYLFFWNKTFKTFKLTFIDYRYLYTCIIHICKAMSTIFFFYK